ncbi:MAG: protein-glutamate O-methyltransferase CheR [Nitrospirota bacterium]
MNLTEFRLLRDLIEEEFGLLLNINHKDVLSAKLEPKVLSLKLRSFREYYYYLLNHPLSKKELSSLPSAIMNMESYFLREKAQFSLFIDLLKEIKKEISTGAKRTIRILSAGCASGQEPYSIYISIKNSGIPVSDWNLQIFGIDIDQFAIEKAKSGVFNQYSLRGMDKEITDKIFRKINNNYHKIDGNIIKKVNFSQGNILQPTVFKNLKNLDFIFCRNLLIYMSKRAKNRIALNLWEALSETGYLFIGQSESLMKYNDFFKPVRFPEAIVYQKRNFQDF